MSRTCALDVMTRGATAPPDAVRRGARAPAARPARDLVRGLAGLVAAGLLATTASAEPFEPEVPRDPGPIPAMQTALYADWEACQAALYPADALVGAPKASSTVRARTPRARKTRAALTIGFHLMDGSAVKPTAAQRALAACVRARFERRWFATGGTPVPGPYALANPHGTFQVVDAGGALGQAEAVRHVSALLAQARVACRLEKDRPVAVTVAVGTDGRPTRITAVGPDAQPRPCLERRLRAALRFPAIARPATVDVRD